MPGGKPGRPRSLVSRGQRETFVTKYPTEDALFGLTATKEYDIIARFSAFVLVMTLVQRQQQTGRLDLGSRRYYETVAFEVCCAAIDHYTSWPGLLNSATFE